MGSVAGCVSGGFGTDGSGFGTGSVLGSGGGDGEWSGVIGVVGILSIDSGSSTYGGELPGSSANRLSITWLISSYLSSFTSLDSSLASGGCEMSKRIMYKACLVTI